MIKIHDKKETVAGTEYLARWENTWLRRSKLEKAPRLLREYESKGRTQHERKRGDRLTQTKIGDGYIRSCGMEKSSMRT